MGQLLGTLSTVVAIAAPCQCMTTRGKKMIATAAAVTIGSGTRDSDVEIVCGTWLQTEQVTHHSLPLVAMRPYVRPLIQMMHQPVGHFMRYDFRQERIAVITIERQVETQTAPPEMSLTSTLAAQVEPYPWLGQFRIDVPANPHGGIDLST